MAQDTPLGFPAHTLPFRCGEVATLSTGSGARYHRRGMGACEGVLRKSRSVHGGSGRFVARGRAADGEKLFSAEGGTWGQMGGNPVIARDTGFGGVKRGGPEKRRHIGVGRLQLRSGWIYVNLRDKTFRAERGAGRWVRRSGGVVRFFGGGMAGFVRKGRKIKKRAGKRHGMGCT